MLLGQDFAKDLNGMCFTAGGNEQPPPPSQATKADLRRVLMDLANDRLQRIPRSSTHELRDGQVRLRRSVPGFAFVDRLGECGDARCGCYRLFRPDVRQHFRDMVVATTLSDFGRTGRRRVRYVTVGSGSLLTDLEVLCALEHAGLVLESIVCIDTAYADGADDKPAADKALAQLGAFFAGTAVYAFGGLKRFVDACVLSPLLYGHTTTFVHCDAGAVSIEDAKSAAVGCLVDEGNMFHLANLGMLVAGAKELESSHQRAAEHSGAADPHSSSETHRMRGYWKAQLRDSYEVKAWRRLPSTQVPANTPRGAKAQLLLEALPAEELHEAPSVTEGRKAQARAWLSQSMRERAAQQHLTLWKVVFEGASLRDGKQVPEAQRHVVAVRSAPDRSASIIATRRRGDQVLASAVTDGWARLSEEDDDWGCQKAFQEEPQKGGKSKFPKEAWMLIDATSLGLGRVLECELDCAPSL